MFVIKRQYEFRCDCGHCQSFCVKPKQFKILKRQMLPLSYFFSKNLGMLVLILVAGLSYYGYQARKLSQQQVVQAILTEPKVNDFFFIDYYRFDVKTHPKYRYTVLKATAVENDIVTLQVGNVLKSRQGNAHDQIKSDRAILDGFFSSRQLTLSTAELAELSAKDIIYEVRRPKNLAIDGWLVIAPQQPKMFVYKVNQDNQDGISMFRGENGYYRDYIGAFEAFTRAAQNKDAAGQHNLAEMYRDGLGTKRDVVQALFWFEQAAKQGYSTAIEQYKLLCQKDLNCELM
jgi:hypothetical protein